MKPDAETCPCESVTCDCYNKKTEHTDTPKDEKNPEGKQEQTGLKNSEKPALNKPKGVLYYTEEEELDLNKFRKLFKVKRKRRKTFTLRNKPERKPSKECSIKVEAWEKHDLEKCKQTIKPDGNYKLVGELSIPVCGNTLFKDPGVKLRKSRKSFRLNEPKMFRKSLNEQRLYAYPLQVMSSEDDELISVKLIY